MGFFSDFKKGAAGARRASSEATGLENLKAPQDREKGWKPDPTTEGKKIGMLRYWDGEKWTEHTHYPKAAGREKAAAREEDSRRPHPPERSEDSEESTRDGWRIRRKGLTTEMTWEPTAEDLARIREKARAKAKALAEGAVEMQALYFAKEEGMKAVSLTGPGEKGFSSEITSGSAGADCGTIAILMPDLEGDPFTIDALVNGTSAGTLDQRETEHYRPAVEAVIAEGRLIACDTNAGAGPASVIYLPTPEEIIEQADPLEAAKAKQDERSKRLKWNVESYQRGRDLEREDRTDEAERLYLALIDATEEDSDEEGGVAPAGYERLAIMYRKQGRVEDEVAILERFAEQKHAPGATPGRLMSRLVKLKQSLGEEAPEWPVPRAPFPDAASFLEGMRRAKTFRGELLMKPDAPTRKRSEMDHSYAKEGAPLRVPELGSVAFAFSSADLDETQTAFFSAWKDAFIAGTAWEVPARHGESYLADYALTYAKDLIASAGSDPGAAAFYLERITDAYPRIRDQVGPWSRDAWLLAGDIRGAIDCYLRKPEPGAVSSLSIETRLTLKHFLGDRIEAWELFGLYPPKVTDAVSERIEDLIEIVQDRLDADHEAGVRHLDDLFSDPAMITDPWPIWNVSGQHVYPIEDAPFARLSQLEAGRELAGEMQRAAENALRGEEGLPEVGQGWVSETKLFTEIRDALDTEVIQHGKPEGFGRQHLDVWMPEWKVGVEYQGAQHYEPVQFFGGEEAFRGAVKRDREKAEKAEKQGVEIVYVRRGYDLDDVLAAIRRARRT